MSASFPALPCIWPGQDMGYRSRHTAGAPELDYRPNPLLLAKLAAEADRVFGVLADIDVRAINWMEGYLADHPGKNLQLVLSVRPDSPTQAADLDNLLRLCSRHGSRAQIRLLAEWDARRHASNLLCFYSNQGLRAISTGPTPNLGFSLTSPSQANLITHLSLAAFEALRPWFDCLWYLSNSLACVRPYFPDSMPVKADSAAWQQLLWHSELGEIHEPTAPSISRLYDPDRDEFQLVDQKGLPVSPLALSGIEAPDELTLELCRIFERGYLVTLDKSSRLPPLEAPINPLWFGVDSFRQTGTISAQTSFKVSPFDGALLQQIERLRKISSELLPHYSYRLASGVRWIPIQAIGLFEAELTRLNDDIKQRITAQVGPNPRSFLQAQAGRIRADAQQMYQIYHREARLPDGVLDLILDELEHRLKRTLQTEHLLPKVSYAPIVFLPNVQSRWSSAWTQAFSLLTEIGRFPRKAMTDRFFWRGFNSDEEQLLQVMQVTSDHLLLPDNPRYNLQQAQYELDLMAQLERCPAEPQAKCRALWRLLQQAQPEAAEQLLKDSPPQHVGSFRY